MTSGARPPLPEDPALDTLSRDVRVSVASAWRRRAQNELSTSTVFASLTRSLVGLGAPHAIVRQAANAVADEVRHAEICIHVASAYWPDCAPPDPSPVAQALPLIDGLEPPLAALLYVISHSCINEGIANVYLQRCLDEATFELARAAVRHIFTDEIHHARFGWSLLASNAVLAPWRTDVGEALPTLLERLADAWTDPEANALPAVPTGHGIISAEAMPGVVRAAYEELILPGFDLAGIDSRAGREWTARRDWA